jgi:cobalt-zinc-cadmium efflux system outer membrane protein
VADRNISPVVVQSSHITLVGRGLTASTLNSDDLISIVLERNPTLEQMTAAAVAAAARYPQVVSFDDPIFAFQTSPFSAGSPNADYAARVELSQKIPLFGKRNLKGLAALAEARAVAQDVDDARLQLVEAAKVALADYYLAEQSLGVAHENLKLLREFRQNAETRYKNGLAPQQDMLQADVETTRLEERVVSLKRGHQVARARINTLAHLPVDGVLPPPADLYVDAPLLEPTELRALAVSNRPDLKAVSDRLAAEQATLGLTNQEFKPDVELMTAYDGYWQGAGGRPLQWEVGVRVNLPIRIGRRNAAVAETRAKVAQRRAELARLTDQIGFQVQEAYEQVRESEQIVKLYETKALPAAESNVKEAQAAYVTGKVPFLSLVEAQRNVIAVRDRLNEARTEVFRRRAALDRMVGEPVPPVAVSGTPSSR